MAHSQAAAALFLVLTSALGSSTCHGQSGGETPKDQGAPVAEVTLPGVDTSPLLPRERRDWSARVTELLAPCSKVPVSIAQCVQEKRACDQCLPAAKLIAKMVRDGMSQEQIEEAYHARFDPEKVKSVDVGKSPFKGPEGARVTLVEFADFECPYCAMMSPILEKLWEDHQGDLRYVYKFFPLQAHPHGELTARAGVAAMNQGKFWELHDKMFANREHLEQTDLDGYAHDIGMDLARFHKDMEAQATVDYLAADKKEADALGVAGTPTIYINGREWNPKLDLTEWLNEELGGEKPAVAQDKKAAPAASGH